MKAHLDFTTLVTAEREPRQNLKILLSSVMPRPIALVSTVSAEGTVNLAPFSFFNAVGGNPPAVVFAPSNRADGTAKDTVANLRAVGEFVVNVVPYSAREAMNETAFPFGPEVDEFEATGFTPVPSRFVRPPRVVESPVHFECKLMSISPVGEGPLSACVCIGEVLCFHVARDHLEQDGTINPEKIDLIGRLGGDDYSTIRDRFAMPRPTGGA